MLLSQRRHMTFFSFYPLAQRPVVGLLAYIVGGQVYVETQDAGTQYGGPCETPCSNSTQAAE